MAKEEVYKIKGKELNEKDACQAMHAELDLLIETNNVILKSLSRVPENIEDIEYTAPFSEEMVDLLNKNWDTQIKMEKEKCLKDIKENNFTSIVKDVNTSIELQPTTIKTINNLTKQAASTGDNRYALEILKFVQKMLQDSNEIFGNQLTYSDKHLQLISEAE